MAVYERSYGRYAGPMTAEWSRFLVLPRYAYEVVFKSKFFVAFLALCFAPPFFGLLIIYLYHNTGALELFGLTPQKLLLIPLLQRLLLAVALLLGQLLLASRQLLELL